MSLTLYQIDAEIAALENAAEDGLLIDEETGELMTVEQALDQMKMMRGEKLENIALWVKNLGAEAEAIKREEDSLTKRRKAAEAKAERLKAYLIGALVREDGTAEKIKTARVAVSVRKNAPSVVFDNEKDIPEVYKVSKVTISYDKDAIKEAIKGGGVVPGAHIERSRSVIIK